VSEPGRGEWLVLAVVGVAFFMTILDVAIVNVAIPSIQKNLNIAESTVQWVITAYAITFGGFLLLGGRLADLLGRRRTFVAGLILFTLASLTCGLASGAAVLIPRARRVLSTARSEPSSSSARKLERSGDREADDHGRFGDNPGRGWNRRRVLGCHKSCGLAVRAVSEWIPQWL
jgi:hypothetical protein